MSLPEDPSKVCEIELGCERMQATRQSVDAETVYQVPIDKDLENPADNAEKDTLRAAVLSVDISHQTTGSDHLATQSSHIVAASAENETPMETGHFPKAVPGYLLGKEPMGSVLTSQMSEDNTAAKPNHPTIHPGGGFSLQTETPCSGRNSKTRDVAGSSVAAVDDTDKGPLHLRSAENDGANAVSRASATSDVEGGPPSLQVESPQPCNTDAPQPVEVKQGIATIGKKPGTTSVNRTTHAPPVLQPEVITIDDDEPVCNFEEPPVLLPEVAMTRKRKGIVRKRSFFGDTVDSSILNQSILESSPSKKANKGSMPSVSPSKPSAQTVFTSRLKDDGMTVLISRCEKSGGNAAAPKPKTPRSSGDGDLGSRKKNEDQSPSPCLLNRHPLYKKISHVSHSVKADCAKTERSSTVIITTEKLLARRMVSGRQPSRRSGATRCGTSIVRGQGRSVDVAAGKHVTSTGWRSVPRVPLDNVSTHCGYRDISEHNREAFAPRPAPPGDLVTLPSDPELTERMREVTDVNEPAPEGVFTSTELEGFLEEKAPLKLSFPVPDCLMRREKLADHDVEYPQPVQPMPAVVRSPGEPRFKTLLEKQVWLGVRDQKDIKAARPTPSPSKDTSFSEGLPLHSLLLPPRYLTPARSSRDLSVHRSRHLLPLCKVMHKSLNMRRAWDEPAKSADCVQFIYDNHHQVRILGSGSPNDGPMTRAYGRLLRPEAVEEKVSAWRRNDYRVSTEVVSRQQALLIAAAVDTSPSTSASGKSSAHHQTPQTPKSNSWTRCANLLAVRHSSRTPTPRRRLLLEDLDTDRKACLSSADRAAPAKEGSVHLEEEKLLSSEKDALTADREDICATEKQESVPEEIECPVRDHPIDDELRVIGMEAFADIESQEQKDIKEKQVDITHSEHALDRERENCANELDQHNESTEQDVTAQKGGMNYLDGKNVEGEIVGNFDHEEQKHPSPEDASVQDGQENNTTEDHEEASDDQAMTVLDVRQENNVSGCQEDIPDQQEDRSTYLHQDKDDSSQDDKGDGDYNLDQREKELGLKTVGSHAESLAGSADDPDQQEDDVTDLHSCDYESGQDDHEKCCNLDQQKRKLGDKTTGSYAESMTDAAAGFHDQQEGITTDLHHSSVDSGQDNHRDGYCPDQQEKGLVEEPVGSFARSLPAAAKDLFDQLDIVTHLHQGNDDGGRDEHADEESYNPDQQEKGLGNEMIGFFAEGLAGADDDRTDALKHSGHGAADRKDLCENAMSIDGSRRPTKPACEGAVQRSNGKDSDVKTCLRQDTLKDLNAIAGIELEHENSSSGENAEMVDSKTTQKMNESETCLPTDENSKVLVTATALKGSVETEPVAHLSFFKSLIKKCTSHSAIRTALSKQPTAAHGISEAKVGMFIKSVVPDEPATETKKPSESSESEVRIVSLQSSAEILLTVERVKSEAKSQNDKSAEPMKIVSSSSDANCAKALETKEECCEEAKVGEKCAYESTQMFEEATTYDLEAQNTNESIAKEDKKVSSASVEQLSSDTVTGTVPNPEPLSVSRPNTFDPATARRVCVHLPRFHLTAVRPFCMFHEVYDCVEYHPGGNCYMTPPRSRIAQMHRNLAIRTGRLPRLPMRHQHSARTFGRVRRKVVLQQPIADSCVAVLPVPDGTPLPPVHAPSARPTRRLITLPDNVSASEVREVVLLTPTLSTDGFSCHGVRLHGGELVRVGPGFIRAGVPWHLQPADNVTVIGADGRRFRNPPDRGCAAFVDVEGSATDLIHIPLPEVNRSLTNGRMALTCGSDGGLMLMRARMRVMCRDRLRRVAVGENGKREQLFSTGSALVMDNAGQLTVIGAVPPEATSGDATKMESKVEGAPQSVQDRPGGRADHSTTCPSAMATDDSDELQVIGTVQGGARERQQATSHKSQKRTADGDANPAGKKQQRVSAEQRSGQTPKMSGEMRQRKALSQPRSSDGKFVRSEMVPSQPRSSDGKFIPSAKKVAGTPGAFNTATKVVAKKACDATECSAPAKVSVTSGPNLSSIKKTKLPSPPTPSWVTNRSHSVTVEVLPAANKSVVTKRSPEPSTNKAVTARSTNQGNQPAPAVVKHRKPLTATGVLLSTKRSPEPAMKTVVLGSPANRGNQPAPAIAKHRKPLTATGLLLSAMQKLAKHSTETKKLMSDVKQLSARPRSLSQVLASMEDRHRAAGNRQLPNSSQLSKVDTNGKGPRKPKVVMKAFTLSDPTGTKSPPKSGDGVNQPRSLLKCSIIAESAAVPVTPVSPIRNPQSGTVHRPAPSPWRKRPAVRQASDGATSKECDPVHPKVRRKSWADLPTSRCSWTNESGAAEGAVEAAVPSRRSWDNPAARKSWKDPQNKKSRASRVRVRRKSSNPQLSTRRGLVDQTFQHPQSPENPQPALPNSSSATQPREEVAARLNPVNSRPLPNLLRCDGVKVRRGTDGGAEPVLVDPPPAPPTPPTSPPAPPTPPPASPTPQAAPLTPQAAPPTPQAAPLTPQPASPTPRPAPPTPQPALVDLTTPEKAPPPRSAPPPRPRSPPPEVEVLPQPASARRRPKLPLEVTLLNESDMSDDGLDDLDEVEPAASKDGASDDVYCPNIELIEL